MIQYNTMYYYTDMTWIPGEYSDCMTGNYDRVLTRIYTDYLMVRDQSNCLTYIWELTECNDITNQSFCDQYIVTSGRDTYNKEPLTMTMPPLCSVLWSYFHLQDGKLWKQLTFFYFLGPGVWTFFLNIYYIIKYFSKYLPTWLSLFLYIY